METSIRKVSDALQKTAIKELNEVPDAIEDSLAHLKDWITKQPHLNVRMDDQWLLTFLRSGKFSLQRTKEKLDAYYSTRTLMPEIFSKRNPFEPDIAQMIRYGNVLQFKPDEGSADPTILFAKFTNCNSEELHINRLTSLLFMIVDIVLNEDDNCAISGLNVVVDLKDLDLGYIFQFTPVYLKKFVTCVQQAYPLRIKGLYCMNAPKLFETAFNILKSFMSKKLSERSFIFSESNSNSVYKYIPQSMMPKEYGGYNKDLQTHRDEWINKLESYNKWFLEESKYGSNESMRVGKPKSSAELFGVEGSFRKLTID